MNHNRRTFLSSTLAAAGLAALAHARPTLLAPEPKAKDAAKTDAARKLKVLILGGTGFLGPACSEAAIARGHTVTLFNRGRTEQRRKEAGRPSSVPDGAEVIYGNRDPEKTADDWKDDSKQNAKAEPKDPNSPKGLSQLAAKIKEGRTWDVVIDTSAYFPRMAKASAELLAPAVGQYIFISTVSVYSNNSVPDKDESDELGKLPTPTTEEFGAQFENYGPGKAACEAAIEAAMPGRVANIRPGFIVGPRDTSARFMYWPARASRGGEMIIPGAESDPMQIIDVRDLAEWMLLCAEQKTVGVFNAVGPVTPLPMSKFAEGCIKGAGGTATAVQIPADFLRAQGVVPEQSFPLWVPPTGDSAGFHRRSNARAVAAGLKFRSVEETAKATLEWYNGVPEETRKRLAPPGLEAAKEAEIIKAFRASKG
jgi:2'-hydroxyisoflavone reductase